MYGSIVLLGFTAGLLQLGGYLFYFKKTFSGHIKPNVASWAIWAIGAVSESVSYIFVTKDWVKNILPLVCALCALAFFLTALKRGHFGKPTTFEKNLIIIEVIILAIWWLTSSAIIANVLLIVTAIISFIPIIISTKHNPLSEDALPWVIWTMAYLSMLVVVINRWDKWEDLLYPAVFLVLHGIVALLALDSRKWKIS